MTAAFAPFYVLSALRCPQLLRTPEALSPVLRNLPLQHRSVARSRSFQAPTARAAASKSQVLHVYYEQFVYRGRVNFTCDGRADMQVL